MAPRRLFRDGCAPRSHRCPLAVVDCGFKPGQNVHGFAPSDSKTDNFKVKSKVPQEIDTRFFAETNGNNYHDESESWIDGLQVLWHDTIGGSNAKSSYYNPSLSVNHDAHVEAPEDGTHRFSITSQPGCTVGWIAVDGIRSRSPARRMSRCSFRGPPRRSTIFIDVQCVQ